MTFKARFAQNLARARKRAGLTQEEVAARASLGRDTVWKHEAEVHVPILDVLVRLAGAVSVQPAELLDGITYRPSFIGLGEGRYEVDRPPSSQAQTSGE
jgi:transcriptional regulator with XRE-family HTH domain